MTSPETSDALAAIGASFGITAAAGAGLGQAADEAAETASTAGLLVPHRRRRPILPFVLPPGILTVTTVGAYLDLPHQFGPRTGWFWDITALSAYGFTAGAVAVTKNFPLVTTAGNPYALEPVASFSQAGVISFGQKGMPLLDATERLVFTVTAALTGSAQISGQAVMVPAERIDEYLS